MIPHADAMCLLARVVGVDAQAIRCEADSHADAANPLRNAHGLPVTAGIEYAAQAMALHAALQDGDGGAPRDGAIAVLSDVAWTRDWLHDVSGPLRVEATLLGATGGGRQYGFVVASVAGEHLIRGAVIVAFA